MDRTPVEKSASNAESPAVVTCPACHAKTSGKFCSNCGAALAAAECASCGAPLRPGSKFCHRCGTAAGAPGLTDQRSFSSALPWAVAAIALVALIALVAGQRFGRSPDAAAAAQASAADPSAAPFAGATGSGRAPDISRLTPAEAAIRLYDRIMGAYERGHADTVQMFAPMAITAYEMLGNLDLDQRYDVGRIGIVSGQEPLARAEADTILAQHPNHLLGLILAADAAKMRKDDKAAKSFHDKLVASVSAERATQLPEYITHENDISAALDTKKK